MSVLDKLKKASTIKETSILSKSKFFTEKDMIPTAVPMINVALSGSLDGGLTPGLTMFAGPSKHFKTAFALLMAKSYMDKYDDAVVLFYDSEFGTPQSYFDMFGVPKESVIHTPVTDIEQLKFDIMKHVKNGKHKIGIVFNTDPHDKPGEHWVSMFIDVRARVIFFFDSTGDPPQKRLRNFMKMVRDQGEDNGIPFKEYINDVRHQKNNSECGVYSIFMVIHMLLGKMTVADFLDKEKKLTDKYMQRFRRKFFNVDEKVPTPNVDF